MLEEDQRRRPPRAINIIRPSSPLFQVFRNRPLYPPSPSRPSSPANSSLAASLISSSSTSSDSTLKTEWVNRQQPSLPDWAMLAKNVGRMPASYYTPPHTPVPTSPLSPSSVVLTADSEEEEEEEEDEEEEDEYDPVYARVGLDLSESEEDEIDESHSESESDSDYERPQVVARMKEGATLITNKGQIVFGKQQHHHHHQQQQQQPSTRLSRQIADLEIENASLSAVNASLEAQAQAQNARIAELESRLQEKQKARPLPVIQPIDNTLTEEDEKAFERVKTMLQHLIEQAQNAIKAQTAAPSARLVLRRSWPTSTVTPKNSHLLRLAGQQQQQQQQHARARSYSMERTSSWPQ
ncbi:hypothetical protein BCR43DRAFT_489910 [Syncephalastrum racemosum]|uniref:Uncharacterized protein n=1 Tax=Syncephalastrum racemosum TaxID=13706 RepID=A0A1X2HEX8_SYNRA|nr:hypothetical protein BCR43DRAFT_489910 [Syncephalastrum racemosum]